MRRASDIAAAAARHLEAAQCHACGHLFLPFGPVCPRCWSDRLGKRALTGLGEVATFTVYRQQYHPDFPAPYVIALVALPEGPRMISSIVDCPPEAVRIGMAVRVRFEARGERWLPVFVPEATAACPATATANRGSKQ